MNVDPSGFSEGKYFWSSLDGIGRAFFMDIDSANQLVFSVWTVL